MGRLPGRTSPAPSLAARNSGSDSWPASTCPSSDGCRRPRKYLRGSLPSTLGLGMRTSLARLLPPPSTTCDPTSFLDFPQNEGGRPGSPFPILMLIQARRHKVTAQADAYTMQGNPMIHGHDSDLIWNCADLNLPCTNGGIRTPFRCPTLTLL